MAGIGFTMSIFVTTLAFDDAEHILMSKTTILLSSLVAGILGYVWLRSVLPHLSPEEGGYEDVEEAQS